MNVEEINAILQLKELFANNGFIIDRFPGIYYDNFSNCQLKVAEHVKEITPDYLGVYVFCSDNTDVANKLTEEGEIILYKDRIEDFSSSNNIDVNDLRFIVLMHELGHWFSHWPFYNDKNWDWGFGVENSKTHESLAQLIAYWMIDGIKNKEIILEKYLTPSDNTSPYSLYRNLIGKSKSSVLKKIVALRESFFLSDEVMYNFLISNDEEIIDYLISIFSHSFETSANFYKVFNDSDFPASTRDFSIEIEIGENEERPVTFDDLLMIKIEGAMQSGRLLTDVSSEDELYKRINYFYNNDDPYYKELKKIIKKTFGKRQGVKYGL